MPITVPNLDDRSYADLLEEAQALLPRYAPEWTNHNPSDPGITLIELLAYVTEILLYRVNRVTRANRIKFLQLLREVTPAEASRLSDRTTPINAVDEALRQTVRDLQRPQRAVTAEDYEALVKTLRPVDTAADPKIGRVRCFTQFNLALADEQGRQGNCPGHVSVVVVPGRQVSSEALTTLLESVRQELEPRRLLTTRLHVVAPFYLQLSVRAEVHLEATADFGGVKNEATKTLQKFFDPLPEQRTDLSGWPFGRAVYLSEIYALLESVPGVDYVSAHITRLSTTGDVDDQQQTALGIQIGVTSTVGVDTRIGGQSSGGEDRLVQNAAGRLIAVALRPYELVKVAIVAKELGKDNEYLARA